MREGSSTAPRRRPGDPPNSWAGIAVGLFGVGVLGLLSFALIAHFMESRPTSFVACTKRLSDSVEGVFTTNQIPTRRLRRGEALVRENEDHVKWQHVEFDVVLAPGIVSKAAEEVIRREAIAHGIIVSGQGGSAGQPRELFLTFSGLEFATVRLQEGVIEDRRAGGGGDKPLAIDHRASCARTQAEVLGVLRGMGVPESDIERGPRRRRENAKFQWTWVRVEAVLPPGISIGAVVDSLALRLDGQNASLAREEDDVTGATQVIVDYAGLECVALVLHESTKTAEKPELPEVALPVLPGPTGENGIAPVDGTETAPNEQGDNLGAVAPEPMGENGALLDALDVSLPELAELPLDSLDIEGHDAPVSSDGATPPKPNGTRIAIIVDDGGYGGEITETILGLDPSLTLAILPFTPHGAATARRASAKGFEVMLHMPMESFNDKVDFPGQITTKMAGKQISALAAKALKEIPEAVGVNNHTGSKFTSDAAAMQKFLEVVEDNGLFYVDSRTSPTSRAYGLAREKGILAAGNDLFLDNRPNAAYIRGQFAQLIELAKRRGSAIGICHFRPVTAQVLPEALETIRKQGVEIVHVSDLLE